MQIDYKDVERIDKNLKLPVNMKSITDINKFMYWQNKSKDHIEAMNQSREDRTKFKENFHQGVLCELEKNKYCRISKREFLLLLSLLKYHNSIIETKVYMDKNGRKVDYHDRRAIK